MELSFMTYLGDEAPISVDACLIGEVADYDRVANIVVVADSTTASSELYDVPSTVIIPAGSNKGTFTVTLKNATELESKTVQLYIKLVDSEDLLVGVKESDHLLFKWNNIMTKPLYWSNIEEFFGEYSETKYRFMLDCLMENGYSTSLDPDDGLNWSDYHNYCIVFTNMLRDYNEAHPGAPLTDENGALVTFS